MKDVMGQLLGKRGIRGIVYTIITVQIFLNIAIKVTTFQFLNTHDKRNKILNLFFKNCTSSCVHASQIARLQRANVGFWLDGCSTVGVGV